MNCRWCSARSTPTRQRTEFLCAIRELQAAVDARFSVREAKVSIVADLGSL
ncbi:hypothetical protein ACWDR3_22455 [Streptomyces sp. NPDC001002]